MCSTSILKNKEIFFPIAENNYLIISRNSNPFPKFRAGILIIIITNINNNNYKNGAPNYNYFIM